MPERVAVLVSGGADSAALVRAYLDRGHTVWPLRVVGGYRWEAVEGYWLRRFLRSQASPKLRPLATLRLEQKDLVPKSHWARSGKVPDSKAAWDKVYLPGRNLLLLGKAGAWCSENGVRRIALGTLKGNPFADAKASFFHAMERALEESFGRAFRIEAPFARLPKDRLLARFPGLPWELTFSCLEPHGRKPCGECTKCFERKRAFRRARLPDPTTYAL